MGLDPQGYGNPDFCWLSLRDTLIWSFAGPIGTVIIVSTVVGSRGREEPAPLWGRGGGRGAEGRKG